MIFTNLKTLTSKTDYKKLKNNTFFKKNNKAFS